MDHRYFARIPLQLGVELNNMDGLIGCFNTCDISIEGVGIQGNFTGQKTNKFIKVKFTDPQFKDVHEAKAQVVYSSVMKMGLIFTQHQSFVDQLRKNLIAVA